MSTMVVKTGAGGIMYDPKQRKREDLIRTKLAEGEAAKATLKEIVLHGKGNAQDVLNSLVLEVRTLKTLAPQPYRGLNHADHIGHRR